MNRHKARMIGILFVVVFACWWGISLLSQQGLAVLQAPAAEQLAPYSNATPIVLHRTIDSNRYAYRGTMTLPSTCYSLGAGLATHHAQATHFTILLTVLAPTVPCASAAATSTQSDSQPFEVSIALKAGNPPPVLDGVTVNGVIVPYTLADSK